MIGETDRDVALWRACLLRAFLDATIGPADIQKKGDWRPKWRKVRRDARQWLLVDRDSFEAVCVMADLDPAHVRDRARIVLGGADSVGYRGRGEASNASRRP